ncbi:DUF192 domain-containing protein [Oceaniglobus ichthyenteri]|uniref:DUF192 domain-containing protein n=1 Tax=Oceaniglobus ichthyenteri TaxID=2136177 RepID=UPI000D3C270D|nr:DUF192 domain-containing protein [Oceaniglobus ichthyenteri]
MGISIGKFGLAVLFVAALPGIVSAACTPTVADLRGDWGQARFTVELADDASERAVGLMNRPQMAKSRGMLFVYERPQAASFWMRNTLIPLDMIFMDETGTVTRIHENAVPLDETPIPGGTSVKLVLEINGGLSRVFGITVGSTLRHPSVAQNRAAWPCSPP